MSDLACHDWIALLIGVYVVTLVGGVWLMWKALDRGWP